MRGARAVLFTIVCSLLCNVCATAAEKVLPPVKLGAMRREPVAAIFWNNDLAAIACAKSGTLIFWDITRGEIAQEFQVGKQLRGVARFGKDELLAVDEKANELVHVRYENRQLHELGRFETPLSPVDVLPFNKRQFVVASLWGRQATIWSRSDDGLRIDRTERLPFEPRHLFDVSGGAHQNIFGAASAFGGELVSFGERPLTLTTTTFGTHIGGSGFDQRQLPVFPGYVFSRQFLDESQPLTLQNIFAGKIFKNEVSAGGKDGMPLMREDAKGVCRNDQNADPAGIAFTTTGMLVCLSGVDQVWYRSSPFDEHPQRLAVGMRPRVVVARDDLALVLGELDDSVSRIEFKDPKHPTVTTKVLDPALASRELSPAERGERLFFSAKMSAGGMMSCHSCHTDGHTNGLLADTLGDNTHGTPKRVLTLRGTRLTDLWSWNGEMKTLQDNVFKSLKETMHAPEIKPADVDDIVSFLHTLPPVPPLKPVAVSEADREQVVRGEKIFQRENCGSCHVPPLTFTSHAVYDVGLADEKGLRKFNPPSLRGVGRLKKLFHDNRANSLRDVFETHGHQLTEPLPVKELDDLVRYLESL